MDQFIGESIISISAKWPDSILKKHSEGRSRLSAIKSLLCDVKLGKANFTWKTSGTKEDDGRRHLVENDSLDRASRHIRPETHKTKRSHHILQRSSQRC